MIWRSGFLVCFIGIAADYAGAAPGVRCDALRDVRLPLVVIQSAGALEPGALIDIPDEPKPRVLPSAVCRVTGVARPTADSEIRFELWIPTGHAWNGKYLQVGNGGFAGKVSTWDFIPAIERGYAVAGTDDGHVASPSGKAEWALGHPEKITDFGYRALKSTHDASIALIRAYRGRSPRLAYFQGCSDGGREALQVAQRFPADFNGVIAGAPALYWTELLGQAAWISRLLSEPSARIQPSKLAAIQAAALAACGGKDGYIRDPSNCRFDPEILRCRAAEDDACLTPSQLAAVKSIYLGYTNPFDHEHWPGPMPGAEALDGGWRDWLTGYGPDSEDRPGAYYFGWNHIAFFVRGDPAFEIGTLRDEDIERGNRSLGPVLDASDPDLRPFRQQGGRLIQYHGWNDPGIPAAHSLRYHQAVARRMGDPSDFYRLYMVPGMLHCGGGRAPNDVDWLAQLEGWVEKGRAPGMLEARHGPRDSAPDGTSQELEPVRLP